MAKKFLKAGLITLAAVPLATAAGITIVEMMGTKAPVGYSTDVVTMSNKTAKVGQTFTTTLTPINDGEVILKVEIFNGNSQDSVLLPTWKEVWNHDEKHTLTITVAGKYITEKGLYIRATCVPQGEVVISQFPTLCKVVEGEQKSKVAIGNKATFKFQLWTEQDNKLIPWKPEYDPNVSLYIPNNQAGVPIGAAYAEFSKTGVKVPIEDNGTFEIEFEIKQADFAEDGQNFYIEAFNLMAVSSTSEDSWVVPFNMDEGGGVSEPIALSFTKVTNQIGAGCWIDESGVIVNTNVDRFNEQYTAVKKQLADLGLNSKMCLKFVDTEENGHIMAIAPEAIKQLDGSDAVKANDIDEIDFSGLNYLRDLQTGCFAAGLGSNVITKELVFPFIRYEEERGQTTYGPNLFGNTLTIENVYINGSQNENWPVVFESGAFAASNIKTIRFSEYNSNIILKSDFARGSQLRGVALTSAIIDLGNTAFADCKNLTEIDITSLMEVPPAWNKPQGVFSRISETGKIFVSKGFLSSEQEKAWVGWFENQGIKIGPDNWQIIEI